MSLIVSVTVAPMFAMATGDYQGTRNAFGRFHGEGTYHYRNGSSYSGDWVDGRKEGFGIQTWHYGDRYEGDWQYNRRHGMGIMVWANGDRYEGEWQHGRMQGEGVYSTKDSLYRGGFKDNERHGRGVVEYDNGRLFEGSWKNGKQRGKAVLKTREGLIRGQWRNMKLQGDALFIARDGARYKGPFVNQQPHGVGQCDAKDGVPGEPCRYLRGKRVPYSPPKTEPPKTEPQSVAMSGGVIVDDKRGDLKDANVSGAQALNAQSPEVAAAAGSDSVGAEIGGVPAATVTIKRSVSVATQSPSSGAEFVQVLAGETGVGDESDSAQGSSGAEASAGAESTTSPENNTEAEGPTRADGSSAADGSADNLSRAEVRTYFAPAPALQYEHNWPEDQEAALAWSELWAMKDSYNYGDLRIMAENADYKLTLTIDNYAGPGLYRLGYFKAVTSKKGVASYASSADKPGVVRILRDKDNRLSGEFEFDAYRNGNISTGNPREIRRGRFTVPIKDR